MAPPSVTTLLFLGSSLLVGACTTQLPPTAPRALHEPERTPISLTYLGVAGYQIQAGEALILADPYFSRPPAGDPVVPDAAAIAAHAPARADLILVGHSHVDHLLDVPSIALATGAQVLGSLSTANVARASGVPDDHIIAIKGGEDFAMPGYSLRVIPSLHSALDHKHTFGTAIAAGLPLPMRAADYAEGGTFAYLIRLAGHEIFFQSTANFIESELVGLKPDIAILAPGLREEIYDYTCRLLRALDYPAVVYANHFDDWHAPAHAAPPSADLLAFEREVHACAPATRVVLPQPFARMTEP